MKSKLLVLLAATAMLASCGEAPSTQQGPAASSEPSASSAPQATYLNWVAEGKIVIDLFTTADARFTYGNAALPENSNTLDLNANSYLACSQQMEGMNFNFVIVGEKESGAAVVVNKAIEGNQLIDYCNDGKEDLLKGYNRAYIAISGGAEVQWAKGKNAAMDAKIQDLINIA